VIVPLPIFLILISSPALVPLTAGSVIVIDTKVKDGEVLNNSIQLQ